MSYQAFAKLKTYVEIETIKAMSPEEINSLLNNLKLKNDNLKEVAIAMREWIDAVPADIVLPTMPGFDRDWADEIIDS